MLTAAYSLWLTQGNDLSAPQMTNEKKVMVTYTQWSSALRREGFLPSAITWMDFEYIMLSEVRERQALYTITYMWNPKNKPSKIVNQGIGSWRQMSVK